MEFNIKVEQVKTYNCGDFVLCDDDIFMIVENENDCYVLLDIRNKFILCDEFNSVGELLRNKFKGMIYRIIKNENMSLTEIN